MTGLARAFDEQWDPPALELFASDLNVKLNNLMQGGSQFERALSLISSMNASRPPRDRELLELLGKRGNASLIALANKLLTPTFLSPTGDPHDAVLLGRLAFVDRADLRQVIREFTSPSPFTTRVLVVHGEKPSGKSYSWAFLRHLAETAGAVPQRLQLKDKRYSPRAFLEQVARLLRLDPREMPQQPDNPQEVTITPLIGWLQGNLPGLTTPYWLVVDDLNDPSVTPEVRNAAYALAYCAEDSRQNLWVALLGYNDDVVDPDMLHIAREAAQFFDAALVAKHFDCIAGKSGVALAPERARELADLLFVKYPTLNKESMVQLTMDVEKISGLLREGKLP
jgi:hypothetical protein